MSAVSTPSPVRRRIVVEDKSARPADRQPVWPLVTLLLAGVLVYLNSFSGVFVFDDVGNIVDNPKIRSLDGSWGRRPVVHLSLALNYALGQDNPFGYHLVNLAVHLLAGLTLFGLVRRTLERPVCGPLPAGTARGLAFATALLWLVHPLQTQGVTYIIQRAESMMALFYLLTLYCIVRSVDAPHRWRWLVSAVLACALGMGSKAVMITAPFVALLFDRVFLAGSFRELVRQRGMLYLGLAATYLVLFNAGVVQGVMDSTPRRTATVGFGYDGVSPMDYFLTQPAVILHYLRLTIWPTGQALDYWWPASGSIGKALLPGLLLAGLLVGSIVCLWKRPALGFAGLFFFLVLGPTSSFVPVKDLAFEHRMYLPLAALMAIAAVGGWHLLRQHGARQGWSDDVVQRNAVTILIVAAVVLGLFTVNRNRDYASTEAMWASIVEARPNNPRARTELANALIQRGEMKEAAHHLETAVQIDPDYHLARDSCGTLLAKLGEHELAAEQFEIAMELKPENVAVLNKLGNAYFQSGQLDRAIETYEKAIDMDPDYPLAHNSLGAALARKGETDRAYSAFRKAIALRPSYVEAHCNMANALLSKGYADQGMKHLREALRYRPDFPWAHQRLVATLYETGRINETLTAASEALRVRPDLADVRYTLGLVLMQTRRPGEAAEQFRLVLRQHPDHPGARQQMEAINAASSRLGTG